MAEPTLVTHPIPPIFDEGSRVLLLGSMPSPKSREVSFYYGNPQNRFWRVLAALWDEELPRDNDAAAQAEKREFCRRHHIALWDVIASCRIEGASDASITDVVANDLSRVLDSAPVRRIFCTGTAAATYYVRLCEPALGIACTRLPSTSPANAAWSYERLVMAWAPVRYAADDPIER